jgi:hypothetical protein
VAEDRPPPARLPDDSPTELVEDERGELVERLSGGTATLLLAWLVGIGALTALLAAWLFVWIVSGERLGLGALFGGLGFYVAVGGASGPCILWLAGRAQGHSLAWFVVTAVKMGLVMAAVLVAVVAGAALLLAGAVPGIGALLAAGVLVGLTLVLSLFWALAVWTADRYIARARAVGG